MAPGKGSSTHQKKVDKVMEQFTDIFSSPTGVPLHCQVKHLINLTLGASLPNRMIDFHFIMENKEIKRKIQELQQKGHI